MSLTKREKDRLEKLLPGGEPRYIRCYDNGGGLGFFCRRKCLKFHDGPVCPDCGGKSVRAGGGSFDRYTVIYSGRHGVAPGYLIGRGMSCHPRHPQGFGQWLEVRGGDDTRSGFTVAVGDCCPWGDGKSNRRIPFAHLPEEVREVALEDYMEIWKLKKDETNRK